jgi:hypothetical protein
MYDAKQSKSENGTVQKFVQNSNRHNSTQDVAECYRVYENTQGLLQGLWTIDNKGFPISPGSAVKLLLCEKEICNTVKDFTTQNNTFQLKKNEFCWIDEDLYHIVEPNRILIKVQRMEPMGENNIFGIQIFALLAPVLSIPPCQYSKHLTYAKQKMKDDNKVNVTMFSVSKRLNARCLWCFQRSDNKMQDVYCVGVKDLMKVRDQMAKDVGCIDGKG